MKVEIQTPYIKLDQLLKYAGVVSSGSDAKFLIERNQVTVNGEICLQRGKKIRKDDIVAVDVEELIVIEVT